MLRHIGKSFVLATMALGAAVASPLAVNAGAGGGPRPVEIARGDFVTLAGGEGLGYSVTGNAIVFRLGDRTVVRAHVRGLAPDTTYPAHVHNAPCSAVPPGGGHYQHVVGGPVDADNEIWPTIETGPSGVGTGFATHAHRARSDAQSIIIHYPVDTSIRLACADLT